MSPIIEYFIFPLSVFVCGAVLVGLWKVILILWNQNALLRDIVREVRPNGGTSMKDSITRIEGRQALISQRLEDHLSQSREDKILVNARIARLENN